MHVQQNMVVGPLLGIGLALLVVVGGMALAPVVFAERVLPGVQVGPLDVSGVAVADMPGVLAVYERQVQQQPITVRLRGTAVEQTLGELGVTLDMAATARTAGSVSVWDVVRGRRGVVPRLTVASERLNEVVTTHFASQVTLPTNASLRLGRAGTYELVAGASGEGIDLTTFEQDVLAGLRQARGAGGAARAASLSPVDLKVIMTAPPVLDSEVGVAQALANELVRDGFRFTFGDEEFVMKASTVQRLLVFGERPDPAMPDNVILEATFDEAGLRDYLTTTIAAAVDQPAIDARFELTTDASGQRRATQFAVPQEGRGVDIDATVAGVRTALASGQRQAALAVSVTKPAVEELADLEALGVRELVASGVSDFVGSPPNRVHNIRVGAARYHGLLVPPGENFSFNRFLGPVDGAHGFKPELVIKNNVTTPEFGGGLCQVSTTAFRAAIHSGLEIVERRNHSYPVRYYGTPGFDATIYPGNTDLRFTNNTPGYILIQTRIEGTKLIFDFWGTSDGRQVEVAGPVTYDRQANGAVKATLTQRVMKDGEVVREQKFYSNYKSPDLFPRVLAADDPAGAAVNQKPAPSNEPAKEPTKQPSQATPNPKKPEPSSAPAT